MSDIRTSSPDYYIEVTEAIKSIYDLTSRIDERVKNIIKTQEDMERRIDSGKESNVGIDKRLNLVESNASRLEDLEEDVQELKETVHKVQLDLKEVEISTAGHDNRWKVVISFGVQLAWVVLASYLLYKLGIQSPSIP